MVWLQKTKIFTVKRNEIQNILSVETTYGVVYLTIVWFDGLNVMSYKRV